MAGEFYASSEPYQEALKKLGDQVILHDRFIPDEEVVNYFCAADVVVQPYKSATQSGISQIAYHFNKPMIVTNVGGLPELVPHNKVGFVSDVDSTSLQKSILQFYNENKETEFIENIQSEKSKFSWGKLSKNLFSFLND